MLQPALYQHVSSQRACWGTSAGATRVAMPRPFAATAGYPFPAGRGGPAVGVLRTCVWLLQHSRIGQRFCPGGCA